MTKKIIILVTVLIILSVSVSAFLFKDSLFPYKGELIAVKKVYHRADCQLLKYYDKKDFIFYSNFIEAYEKSNRQCKTCMPPYFTVIGKQQYDKEKEAQRVKKEAEEKKKKEIDTKVIEMVEERYPKRAEELKKQWEEEDIQWQKETGITLHRSSFFKELNLKKKIEQEVRQEMGWN